MQTNHNQPAAGQTCKGIITYKKFKNDQAVGVALLRMHGEKKYPGIKNAPIFFWDVNQESQDGKSVSQLEKEGYVFVSVGNTKYDDHPLKNQGEKTCSAILIAEDLGVADDLYLEQILDFTLQRDLTGKGHFMSLPALLSIWHKRCDDSQLVMEWYLQAIEVLINNEYDACENTEREFKKVGTVNDIYHAGRKIKIAVFTSDNENMARYARSRKFGPGADVIVQKSSKGNVQITSRTSSKIDFDEVMGLIRLEERKYTSCRFLSEQELKSAGTLKELPDWYYDRSARRILNGSGSAQNTPPTKISFERLLQLIVKGLQKQIRYGNSMQDVKKARA